MKRNTMRVLCLMLTLVMLLSAVPFAAAADPSATITGDASVWAGETVELEISAPVGYTLGNVLWTHPNNNVEGGLGYANLIVTVAVTSTYKVSYELINDETGVKTNGTDSFIITVKEPAGTNFAISGVTTAVAGQSVSLVALNANDSNVVWSVSDTVNAEISSSGVFKATKAGTYTVTAVAEGDTADVLDDQEDTHTIVVSASEYTVTLNDASYSVGAANPKMTYSIKKGNTTYTGSVDSKHFNSSNTSVATINASTGALVLKKEGTSTITLTVTIDGQTYSDTATLRVANSGIITLEQDGECFDDDTIELEFDIPSLDSSYKSDVDWTFEVNGLDKLDFAFSKNNKDEYEYKNGNPSIDIDLKAVDGYGVARIDVWADWGNGSDESAEATFYVGIYDEIDIKVTLADKVDEFDFDEDEVFSTVYIGSSKQTDANAKKATIEDLLDDDTAMYVDLEERKPKDNEDVGEITCNKSTLPDWENDEVNQYKISDLQHLSFEADDEGYFDIEYIQYQYITGYTAPFITGEGILRIIVGDGNGSGNIEGDIEYECENKKEVDFDEDDFEEFWEDYCDDEDINEDLEYVKFDTKTISGTLTTNNGKKNALSNSKYKFHFKYDDDEDDGSSDFDLDDITYTASSSKTNYVEEIDFTCYGEDGEEAEGTITIVVGKGEEEEKEETNTNLTMDFADVRTNDWYYSAVEYVYTNQIMAGTGTNTAGRKVFEPNTKLSRAMVATVLYRIAGEPTITSGNSFTDVKDTSAWYYKAVCWAAKEGIVTGTTKTTFAPNNYITRQDLALMLYRFAKYQGKSTTATGSLTMYSDYAQVGSWSTDAMKWAVGTGIITGSNNRLNPTGNATRAEAAAMFQRYMAK